MLKCGFEPVFDKNSKVLILGSFPSVKSRQIEFYYGNKQNRFWRTVCGFFGEAAPETVSDKIDFLLRRKIALWDIVTECEIVGSRDDTIKNFKVADLKKVLQKSQISFIIINGGKAYDIFLRSYPNLEIPHKKLCSTSPANTRFNESEWRDVLSGIFG
ncbi:MAG: DNA-deoxyinosine glycosylase [Clostridia bacterium]|nr:DNA-deoxyinosine glycosylase [Clostridia bacterium]